MLRFLLDTNVCIRAIKGEPPCVRERLMSARPEEVAISRIVHYELLYGIHRSNRPKENLSKLNHFLKFVEVLDFGEPQAAAAARVRADLAERGQPIGPCDTLIAGHALSVDATLVTNNVREFARVDGLEIEDWES